MSGADFRQHSSGERWTAEDDERLRVVVLAVAKQFPGRSPAAVLARIERFQGTKIDGHWWPGKWNDDPAS